MAINKLDGGGIENAAVRFRDSIRQFQEYTNGMERATRVLLLSWHGKGRDQFEIQYRLLKGKLADISDELFDIYEALVSAGAAYAEADNAIAKQMTMQE